MTILERFIFLGMKLEKEATLAPAPEEQRRLRRLARLFFQKAEGLELEARRSERMGGCK